MIKQKFLAVTLFSLFGLVACSGSDSKPAANAGKGNNQRTAQRLNNNPWASLQADQNLPKNACSREFEEAYTSLDRNFWEFRNSLGNPSVDSATKLEMLGSLANECQRFQQAHRGTTCAELIETSSGNNLPMNQMGMQQPNRQVPNSPLNMPGNSIPIGIASGRALDGKNADNFCSSVATVSGQNQICFPGYIKASKKLHETLSKVMNSIHIKMTDSKQEEIRNAAHECDLYFKEFNSDACLTLKGSEFRNSRLNIVNAKDLEVRCSKVSAQNEKLESQE